jgi:UDP-N-acetylmuramate--alanine ligase
MLAELMRLKQGIAVAGTTARRRTTSLVASVLAEGRPRSDVRDRGRLEAAGSNARLGAGEFIVVGGRRVGCLVPVPAAGAGGASPTSTPTTWKPTTRSLDRLRQAFVDFLQRLPFYGVAVLCATTPTCGSSCRS